MLMAFDLNLPLQEEIDFIPMIQAQSFAQEAMMLMEEQKLLQNCLSEWLLVEILKFVKQMRLFDGRLLWVEFVMIQQESKMEAELSDLN